MEQTQVVIPIQAEVLPNEEKQKSVIVGRVWINNKVLSGYVVIAPGVTIKFGANIEFNPSFLYLSRK